MTRTGLRRLSGGGEANWPSCMTLSTPEKKALKLGERQRAVIVLHDVEGYKHAEIGTLLGIPEGTARSDLHHARTHLRRLLGNLRSTE